MRLLQFRPRKLALYILDVFMSITSIYGAFLLRGDWNISSDNRLILAQLLPFTIVCRSASYFYFGFYSRFWEYSTIEDLVQILKSVFTGTFLILFASFIYNRAWLVPRSVIVIDIILLITLLGGARMIWRIYRERVKNHLELEGIPRTKVLILGAGNLGAHLLKHLRQFSPNYVVVGFIDDKRDLINDNLMGIQILGNRNDIPGIAKSTEAKELLIAARNISSKNLSELIDICTRCGIKHKIITSIMDLSTKEIHISKIKNVEIADLLEREIISLDLSSINRMVHGKRVLVTGAGGSIGSQLCSHLLKHQPSTLIMIDTGENYLHDLKMELTPISKTTKTYYVFGSVANSSKMEPIFLTYQPQLVFHVAAHKHVPLMEENVDAAITNNIYGTKLTAELSDKYNIEKFVLVSTDKVVRPINIMGMTKKLAEAYIQFMSTKSQTQFIIVRFGNVLGSNGSVVPLFEKQIAAGGPLTITHPDMERFFMVIPEAVQLILQAGAIGTGGEIFLLKMGKPIKIKELANKMIKLSGYEPDNEIKIEYTGVRPGEKLVEELTGPDEQVIATPHEKISLIRSKSIPDINFKKKLESLCLQAQKSNQEELKNMTQNIISELSTFNKHTDPPQ